MTVRIVLKAPAKKMIIIINVKNVTAKRHETLKLVPISNVRN